MLLLDRYMGTLIRRYLVCFVCLPAGLAPFLLAGWRAGCAGVRPAAGATRRGEGPAVSC